MFTKQDEQLDQMAADPVRRREGIVGLSWRRNVMFWCAVVMTLCALATFFMSLRSARGGAAIGFAAAVQWMLLFKFESDLRLLRVVERLHSTENGKTSD
jgi:hypothetical protein